MAFLAFDSFEGLPEVAIDPGVSGWQPGSLTTSEETFLDLVREHGLFVDKIETFKGFFNASLTAALGNRLLAEGRKAAFITVDCDLEESAIPIFPFIEPFLQEGTVIYIDDYFVGYRGNPTRGVSRIFHDYEKTSQFKFIQHLQVGWTGRTFIAYRDRP